MHFHFSFYSSLLLIFFTHGLLFSILLVRKAALQNESTSYWLAGFTFVCTLNIAPWMLGHAGWYSLQPYRDILFYMPLQHFFLLGPLIFFYTKRLLNPGVRFRVKDRLHFLPAALYIVYTAVMFITDKLVLGSPFFYADGRDRDLDTWYRLAGILSLSTYLILSLRYYALYKRVAEQLLSFADAVLLRWMRNYLIALFAMQVLDIVFFCLYPAWGSFTSKWWYYFIFSGLFYYVAFSAYTSGVRSLFAFRLAGAETGTWLVSKSPEIIEFTSPHNSGNEYQLLLHPEAATIPAEEDGELLPWKEKLLEAVLREEAYKDPELTLTHLAKRLKTNASVLSRIVNKGFGLNFNDFINGYRVEAVKKSLEAGEHKRQTLLGIAFDCGFNSKTTFNRVFKKHTGLSPKDYLRQLKPLAFPEKYNVPDHDLERPQRASFPSSSQITGL